MKLRLCLRYARVFYVMTRGAAIRLFSLSSFVADFEKKILSLHIKSSFYLISCVTRTRTSKRAKRENSPSFCYLSVADTPREREREMTRVSSSSQKRS